MAHFRNRNVANGRQSPTASSVSIARLGAGIQPRLHAQKGTNTFASPTGALVDVRPNRESAHLQHMVKTGSAAAHLPNSDGRTPDKDMPHYQRVKHWPPYDPYPKPTKGVLVNYPQFAPNFSGPRVRTQISSLGGPTIQRSAQVSQHWHEDRDYYVYSGHLDDGRSKEETTDKYNVSKHSDMRLRFHAPDANYHIAN